MNIKTILLALLSVSCMCTTAAAGRNGTIPDQATPSPTIIPVVIPPTVSVSAPVITIMPRELMIVKLIGGVSITWADSIEKVCQSTSNPKIILWIESGGGGVQETRILVHKMEVLKKKYNKTFIAYTERWLMSGAYWVACVADSLYASPDSYVGSIGVFVVRTDITAYDSTNGGKYMVIKSGKLKNISDQHTKMTDDEKTFWQEFVNKEYGLFVNYIYAKRTLQILRAWEAQTDTTIRTPKEFLIKLADGRFYATPEAMTLGLVDQVLYMEDIIASYGENVDVKIVEVISNSSIQYPYIK